MKLLRNRKINLEKTSEEKIKKTCLKIINEYKELIKANRTTLEEINDEIVEKIKSYKNMNENEKKLLYAVIRDELRRKKTLKRTS